MINLGFSGNGQREPEVLSLITEIDAKLYVLDCLPNRWNPKDFSREEVIRRTVATVNQIRKVRPATLILEYHYYCLTVKSMNPCSPMGCTRMRWGIGRWPGSRGNFCEEL